MADWMPNDLELALPWQLARDMPESSIAADEWVRERRRDLARIVARKLVEHIERNFLDQYSEYKHGKSSDFWQQLRKEVLDG